MIVMSSTWVSRKIQQLIPFPNLAQTDHSVHNSTANNSMVLVLIDPDLRVVNSNAAPAYSLDVLR